MKDSRGHILETSFKLFMTKNYKEVTMKEIVEKTGLSKGAFYHYFASKEEVFRETINHYFLDMLNQDYGRFSHESLKAFCNDYLEMMREMTRNDGMMGENMYQMIFEAIKIFPDFKEKFIHAQEAELAAWRNIIGIARSKGEIASDMSDDILAKLFIYVTDGVGIRYLIGVKLDKLELEVKAIWDGIYKHLRT